MSLGKLEINTVASLTEAVKVTHHSNSKKQIKALTETEASETLHYKDTLGITVRSDGINHQLQL